MTTKINMNQKSKIDFNKIQETMRELNPLGFILRSNIADATGGIITAGTLSHLDIKGQGISPRYRIGKKIAYPIDAVINFIQQQCHVIDEMAN